MTSSTITIQRTTSHAVGDKRIAALPTMKNGVSRDLLHETFLENGMHCTFWRATEEDVGLIQSILQAAEAKNKDKHYLLPRTDEQVAKTIHDGFVMLIALNGNQGAGVMGADDIDDENDSGRGAPYKGCPLTKQICMKMAGIHPAANGLNLYNLSRPYRMAGTIEHFPDKTCIITKTNNPFVKYTHAEILGWDLGGIYDLNNERTIDTFMHDPVNDNDALLHTYVTCQEREIKKLARENGDLITRSEVLKHLHERYSLAKTQNGLYVPA